MKTITITLFLLLLHMFCFSQKGEQIDSDLVFIDACSGNRIEPEFKIKTYSDTYKMITAYVNRGNLIAKYTVLLDPTNDTINVPKILFAFNSKTDDTHWNAMHCNKVCNGTETEFYSNGNKSTQGLFVNGKPLEIKTYRKNGSMISHTFYDNMSLDFSRVNYYTNQNELNKYQTFENNETERIIKVFDKDGNLVDTSIDKKADE